MDGTEYRYHEYYIHVKSAQGARTSDNINVSNPDYIFPEQEIGEVVITPISAIIDQHYKKDFPPRVKNLTMDSCCSKCYSSGCGTTYRMSR